MKRTLVLLTAGALLFTACQDDPKADSAQTGEATTAAVATGATYKADLNASRVEWTGTKPTGEHRGANKLKDGSIMVENGAITGGKFDIDMTSLQIIDKGTNGASKLAGHLSSPDFFDAAKFPTATFEITGVKAGVDSAMAKDLVMKDATHTVSGNLTLKGVTKGISFPAKISVTDPIVTADANFNIDRSEWGIVYNNDKGLGDKFIRPTVNINLHLVANK
jgi:polyisoprenoid-binding protein YceI